MKQLKKIIGGILLMAAISGIVMRPEIVKADEATVTFGSEGYSWETNGEFPLGVYINGDSVVGTYRIELEYDNRRLEYIGGAESEQNGIIVLEGTGVREQIKYMLSFRTISGGEAYIKVKNATVNMRETDNAESFEVTELDSATIDIAGEDTVGDLPEIKPAFETDIPHIEPAILLNGTEYYLLNLNQQIPENVSWSYDIVNLTFMEQQVAFLTNPSRSIYYAYLFDETERLTCYAYEPSQKLFYPCDFFTVDGESYYYTSPSACTHWPEELTLDIVKSQNVIYAMDMDGNADFSVRDKDGKLVKWNADEGKKVTASQTNKLVIILVLAVVLINMVLIGIYFTTSGIERKKRKKHKKMMEVSIESLEQEKIPRNKASQESVEPLVTQKENTKKRKRVISVQNVTMRFKVSTSNVSGIKEYLIQLLKRQITYRELLALDHISFDVYKGEVVGIIGTNGSGKSTLLRIVSGALNPTEGQVLVNRKKVQLLTLGTGFDMELTAKENVYLNGAIIGYTKEFIDEHYDEIVAFAELEGFMEEKVKNFSSGMVSRLGFAIATVGEASEILILDEVLSVGDEFFRQKSLARIKEMIHGGSTVLMVSHSMGTIREHCSKVVWIEKGVLRMVGEPKEVCEAYQKQHSS